MSLPSEDISRVERRVYAPAFLYAPVRAGDTVGEIRWYLEGDLLGSAPLTAGESAPLQEEEPGFGPAFLEHKAKEVKLWLRKPGCRKYWRNVA